MTNGFKVGYQGECGAYSDLAAFAAFQSKAPTTVPFKRLDQVLAAVEAGDVEAAVLPVENTVSGTFHGVLDGLLRHPTLHISGELCAHDSMSLITLPGVKLEDITRVQSHPHVLEQCQQLLASLGDKVTPVATLDSAGACLELVQSGRKDTAAIADSSAATATGVCVLKEGVEDDVNSSTRYVIITRQPSKAAGGGTRCKTSLAVHLKNRPGAIFKATGCFAMRDINICKLESRPSSRAGSLHGAASHWETFFVIDVEGAMGEANVKAAVTNLEEFATKVRVLGSYPAFVPKMQSAAVGPFNM